MCQIKSCNIPEGVFFSSVFFSFLGANHRLKPDSVGRLCPMNQMKVSTVSVPTHTHARDCLFELACKKGKQRGFLDILSLLRRN